jgi:hypothetical protein
VELLDFTIVKCEVIFAWALSVWGGLSVGRRGFGFVGGGMVKYSGRIEEDVTKEIEGRLGQ